MSAQSSPAVRPPLWLLAELTYRCPLHCVFCSNPVDYARHGDELDTAHWKRILAEARALGAVQLGFSGGEPPLRRDLEGLVAHARALGRFRCTAFAAVDRDPADPRRPAQHRDNDAFWTGRGYQRQPGMTMQLPWDEIDAGEIPHPLTFWLRPLDRAADRRQPTTDVREQVS